MPPSPPTIQSHSLTENIGILEHDIKITYGNMRAITNKIAEVSIMLTRHSPDIFCATETWLKEKHLDCNIIRNKEYTILRCDRTTTKSAGGGVAMFVKSQFVHNIVHSSSQEWFELLIVDLFMLDRPFRVILVYFKPASTGSHVIQLVEEISQFVAVDFPCFVLGDFNLPSINWKNQTAYGSGSVVCLKL